MSTQDLDQETLQKARASIRDNFDCMERLTGTIVKLQLVGRPTAEAEKLLDAITQNNKDLIEIVGKYPC